MSFLWGQHRWGFFQVSLICSLISLCLFPGIGWSQPSSRIWSGTGQIISGAGQGGTVQLSLEIDNGRIRTRSGPDLDAPLSQNPQTIESGGVLWQIENLGDRLSVTLHRSDQVIRYQLLPESTSPAPVRSRLLPNPDSGEDSLLRDRLRRNLNLNP